MRATCIRSVDSGNEAGRVLWRVEPPVLVAPGNVTDYVVTSAVVAIDGMKGAEVAVFPSDAEGGTLSRNPMTGSYQGGLSHDRAMRNAGYELVFPQQEVSEYARELLDAAIDLGGIEISRAWLESLDAAQELVRADLATLGAPRGPGGSWSRLEAT